MGDTLYSITTYYKDELSILSVYIFIYLHTLYVYHSIYLSIYIYMLEVRGSFLTLTIFTVKLTIFKFFLWKTTRYLSVRNSYSLLKNLSRVQQKNLVVSTIYPTLYCLSTIYLLSISIYRDIIYISTSFYLVCRGLVVSVPNLSIPSIYLSIYLFIYISIYVSFNLSTSFYLGCS